jgi:hypothetical protein
MRGCRGAPPLRHFNWTSTGIAGQELQDQPGCVARGRVRAGNRMQRVVQDVASEMAQQLGQKAMGRTKSVQPCCQQLLPSRLTSWFHHHTPHKVTPRLCRTARTDHHQLSPNCPAFGHGNANPFDESPALSIALQSICNEVDLRHGSIFWMR